MRLIAAEEVRDIHALLAFELEVGDADVAVGGRETKVGSIVGVGLAGGKCGSGGVFDGAIDL